MPPLSISSQVIHTRTTLPSVSFSNNRYIMLRGGDFTTHMDNYKENESKVPLVGGDIEQGFSRESASNKEVVLRLYEIAKPERSLIICSAVTLAFTSLVQLTTPYLSGHIIDVALKQHNGEESSSTVVLLMSLFAVIAFAAYLTYLQTTWQAKAGHRMVARLRRQLYAAILSQDAAFFDSHKTGDLLSRLSSDADLLQDAVQGSVLGGFRGIAMSMGAAVMLLYISWPLALVALMILPTTMTAARVVGRKVREKHKRVRELQAEATSLAETALTCITTVQQFVAEKHESELYNQSVNHAHHEAIETARLQAAFSGIVQIAGNGSMLCVLGYGGSLVATGQLTAGALASFVMYALIMAGNVSGLSNIWVDLMKSVAAANRLFEIMDRTPSIPAPNNMVTNQNNDLSSKDTQRHYSLSPLSRLPRSNSGMRPLSADFQNVTFSYPARLDAPVLTNFSLSVRAGEVMALVGGSGAGKSTMAALLTRLYDVSQGSVLIDGVNLQQMTPHDVRRNVGIVSQEPLLFPTSIADNIRYGKLDATEPEIREAARLANVLEFAESFPRGLDTVVGARGTQLSGGQKQRVAIARAILKDPPIVIFDEATSALDAESEHQVQNAIDTAMKGRTVISIAHRLSTIRSAHRIAVVKEGRVAEIGTFDDLVSKPNGSFRQLMERQLVTDDP
jgi:ABC-type multidrug transport system fused ATPase/permease subunit